MVFAVSCLLALAGAAPKPAADAEAEADAFYHGNGAAPFHAVQAGNCKTDVEVLVTQKCVPTTENVCETKTVDTEEIEYEKVCKEVIDTICDQPAYGYHTISKREAEAEADADAEADARYLAAHPHIAHAPLSAVHVAAAPVHVAHVAAAPVHVAQVAVAHVQVAPVAAHAVAHSVTKTVKHACREVKTQHCVDNPKAKNVPVQVEHCHTVTKVACTNVNNEIPKTTCEAVETTHVSHAAYAAAPVAHAVPVAHVGYVQAPHAAPLAAVHGAYGSPVAQAAYGSGY